MAKEKEQYFIAYLHGINGKKIKEKRPMICTQATLDQLMDLLPGNVAFKVRTVDLELVDNTKRLMARRG